MMSASKELLMAILSMDAYNRGYDPGLIHGESQIGTATFTQDDISQEARANSFYAVAYDTPYGKVISYRGTDDYSANPWITASDIDSSRVAGAGGSSTGRQGQGAFVE